MGAPGVETVRCFCELWLKRYLDSPAPTSELIVTREDLKREATRAKGGLTLRSTGAAQVRLLGFGLVRLVGPA
jgi:hypothetical protein